MSKPALSLAIGLAFSFNAAFAQDCGTEVLASNGAAGDQFGSSVAVSGDLMVVGAPVSDAFGSDSGAAYVFRKTGGVWVEEASLVPSSVNPGDSFGYDVAVDGDLIVVGARFADLQGVDSGQVFVFRYDAGLGDWLEEQILVSSTLSAGDSFGTSVEVEGDRIAVGSMLDNAGGVNSGSAFVFRKVGTTWVEEDQLVSNNLSWGDYFGVSVALQDDRVVVGAVYEDTKGGNAGAAYVFERTGSDWSQTAMLTASDGEASDFFGIAVDIDNNLVAGPTIIIGAEGDDDAGAQAGAGYVFRLLGGQWLEMEKLVPVGAEALDAVGNAVAIELETLILSSKGDDSFGLESGAAYLYYDIGANWLQATELTAPQGAALDLFSVSMDLSDDTAAFGAIGRDTLGNDAGAVFTFDAVSADCNGNYVPDICDLLNGTSLDCNNNNLPDDCDIAFGLSEDCNLNGVPDECETVGGFPDCNINGIWDECDIVAGTSTDCNSNGIPDECDLAAGIGSDLNNNGVFDDCEPLVGTVYCSPNQVNSTGMPASILARGSALVTDNDLILDVQDVPLDKYGYFLGSLQPGTTPFPGGSQGILCLFGSIARFNQQVFNSGTQGRGTILVDLTAMPAPTGPQAVLPGETWYFQSWYRDLNPGASSNFSDGVSVLFQ